MKIRAGFYTSHLSDLLVKIVKVHYDNGTYVTCKLELYNKHNRIFYEKINAKLYYSNITHWNKVYNVGV